MPPPRDISVHIYFFLSVLRGRDRRLLTLSLLLGDGQKELELRGQLLFRVQAIGEVYPADPAVGVNLNPQCLDVVRPVRSAGEVAQVELDLVPPLTSFFCFCTGYK